MLWPWPLTSWPWTFTALRVSCLNSTKFKRNRIIHGWVIDDIACFALQLYGVGHNWQKVLGGVFTQLYQTCRGRRAIIASCWHCPFVSKFAYLAAFSNAGGSNLSNVENDAKLCTFDFLWKLGEGWLSSLYQFLKLYLRNKFVGHQLHGCWARCIDKNKYIKFTVKLKAFRLTSSQTFILNLIKICLRYHLGQYITWLSSFRVNQS